MKKILIVTGGTGGHVVPSLSIYDHLKERFEISLVTDQRGSKFINKNNYKYTLIDVPNLFSKLHLIPFNLINGTSKSSGILYGTGVFPQII